MSKRLMQENQDGEKENRGIATHANLVALTPNGSSLLPSLSSPLQSPGNTGASCSRLEPGSTGRPVARDSSASNASTSQVWPADLDTDTGTGRPVARPNKRTTDKDLVHHCLSVSSQNWACVDSVFGNVPQKLGLPDDDPMDQVFINKAIRRIFTNVCMWASVHFDKDQDQNLRVLRNTGVSEVQPMFSITQNRIHSLGNVEVFGLNTFDWV